MDGFPLDLFHPSGVAAHHANTILDRYARRSDAFHIRLIEQNTYNLEYYNNVHYWQAWQAQ